VTDTTTDSAASTQPPGATRPAPAVPAARRRKSKRLWVVFVLLAAAFVFLLVEGLGSSLNYFDTVDQAYAQRDTLGTSTFRLEGTVVSGTIHSTATGADFAIAEGARSVQVANTGSPPQLFQSDIPVVVVGHFTSSTSNDFVSNSILVKHSATYIAKYPSRVKGKNGKTLP
jgi:cytochrome c-type biogenesis protein CcmE